jgi:hypothetical protein
MAGPGPAERRANGRRAAAARPRPVRRRLRPDRFRPAVGGPAGAACRTGTVGVAGSGARPVMVRTRTPRGRLGRVRAERAWSIRAAGPEPGTRPEPGRMGSWSPPRWRTARSVRPGESGPVRAGTIRPRPGGMGGGSPPCWSTVRTRPVCAEPAGTRRPGRPRQCWWAVRARPVQPGPEEHRLLAGRTGTRLGRRPGLAGRTRPAEPGRLQHRVLAGSGRSPAGTGLGGSARQLAGRARSGGLGSGSPPGRSTLRPRPQEHRVVAGRRDRSGTALGGTGPGGMGGGSPPCGNTVPARPQEHGFLASRRPRSRTGTALGGGIPPCRGTVPAGRAQHRLVAGRS